ncbi:uncharacterized protein EDB93DRAFT_1100022 [Suillus bovinus]|uniref:uncharacterized protein n=1 Tax=Suillus bovinus TaxID=48563 RepID=UPI001B85D1F0|nr:uncharacterized protein EDB93DRAFT_1100022 [Suillus bovinus]KAG2158958.1 hypothetical protein EDB93DRAFT_1100022 [Suillus bovinus]
MPKQKLFNVANLGSWAKSLGHSGNKENEVPMTINVSESPPSSLKRKKRKVTITVVLDPPPFVLQIIELSLSPLYESKLKHPSQCAMGEASPPDSNINMASARINTVTGFYKPSPTVKEAHLAFNDIKRILRLPKKTAGYKDPKLDSVFCRRLEGMKQFLWVYVDPQSLAYGKWTMASLLTAKALEQNPHTHEYSVNKYMPSLQIAM